MDIPAGLRAVLALMATLGILGALAYAAKRFDLIALLGGESGPAGKKLAGVFTARPATQRRLHIVEQRALDARSRLLIVRWDDAEHLILTGAGDGTLIASKAAQQILPAPTQTGDAA